jgi:hypothetical protein
MIFLLSKFIIHGTLKFDLNSLLNNLFNLGLALVIKRWLWQDCKTKFEVTFMT